MVDVAAHAGVSLKTVSRAINSEPHVDPVLAARVAASAEVLGYHRNSLAASLRSGARDTIGFLSADLSNSFYSHIAAAASAVAVEHGMQLIVASSEEDANAEKALALDFCQRRVGGLIVVPTASDHSYLATEMERGTPSVFVDRPAHGIDADQVLLDNRGGAYAAVKELLSAGHERIALLFDSLDIYTMAERRAGACAAFADAGRALDPRLTVSGLHTPEAARAAMERILAHEPAPTAVFCANNRVTIGVLEQLLPLRSDIALSCFDDFELSRVLPRAIRIVDYDTAELGRRATKMLIERIATDASAKSSTELLPTRLITRGGTSTPGG
ncbi:LacI family DNA-binding transcriptional regulator [Microbacterium sp. NPDC076911]|uniref:LacI family DNA-binding transcriptional regulator n=1 Tax=Microbacterium sp. NPDC076911 TaxID=3154958 RepID=UPI00343BD6B0